MTSNCKCGAQHPEEKTQAFLLPYQTDIGYAVVAIGRLLIYRRDLQVAMREGEIRIGYIDDEWDDLEVRIGTRGIEPLASNWERVATLATSLPSRLEYANKIGLLD